MLAQDLDLMSFGFSLLSCRIRYVVKGQPVVLCCSSEIFMIRDDTREIASNLTCLEPEDNIVEAVCDLRDEDGDFGPIGREGDRAGHTGGAGQGLKRGGFLAEIGSFGGCPLQPLEKDVGLAVVMLIGVAYVALVLKNPLCQLGSDARLVGAVEEGDEGGWLYFRHRQLGVEELGVILDGADHDIVLLHGSDRIHCRAGS